VATRRRRKKPGTAGGGRFYRVVVRTEEEFVTFRYHDVGAKGGDLERLTGKRESGSWDTQAWLIRKGSAHLEGDMLVADKEDVRELLRSLGSRPIHIKGDIFEAKPTPAQKRARSENIKKAREARWQVVAHEIRRKLKGEDKE